MQQLRMHDQRPATKTLGTNSEPAYTPPGFNWGGLNELQVIATKHSRHQNMDK